MNKKGLPVDPAAPQFPLTSPMAYRAPFSPWLLSPRSVSAAPMVSDPHHERRHRVAPVLVCHVGHIVIIEFWTNENMLGNGYLHAHSHMDLEVIRVADRLRSGGA